jgi:hypothetical protein
VKKQQWDEIFEPLIDAMHKVGRNMADHMRKQKEKVSEFLHQLDGVDHYSPGDLAHTPGGGLPKSKIDEIVAIPKPYRPNPRTYKTKAEIEAHLKPFLESGAVRFTSRAAYGKYGTIGPSDGTYVVSLDEFKSIMERTKGDLPQVERILGLDAGTLGNADTMVVHIAPGDLDGLRMPDGNEAGANSHWLPGGVTSGGVPEATVNAPKSLSFTEIHLGGKS